MDGPSGVLLRLFDATARRRFVGPKGRVVMPGQYLSDVNGVDEDLGI